MEAFKAFKMFSGQRMNRNIPFCITGQEPNFSVLKSCLKMEAFKAFKMFSGLNNLVVWPIKYLTGHTTRLFSPLNILNALKASIFKHDFRTLKFGSWPVIQKGIFLWLLKLSNI